MDSPISEPAPLYGWAIKGLGGVVTILEIYIQAGLAVSPHWFAELRTLSRRLEEAVKKCHVSD